MTFRPPVLLLAATVVSAAACHKTPPAPDQNIAIDNGMDANADIEALPPDESSGTPTNELENGDDNPDVNGSLNNSD